MTASLIQSTSQISWLSIEQWQAYVEWHENSSIFHHRNWLELLREQYGFKLRIPAVVVDEKITAAIPLLETKNLRGKRKLISLPFTDYLPVLADNEAAAATLCQLMQTEFGGQFEAVVLRADAPIPGLEWESHNVRHELGTALPLAEIEAAFASAIRRNLGKSKREKLEFHKRSDEKAIEIFFRLHVLTRKKLGVPVQSKSYFRNLYQKFIKPGLGFVGVVTKADQPIAAVVLLGFNDRLVYKYAASDPSALELRPNDLLVYNAIRIAAEEGYRVFDFGITDKQQEGLRRFKSKWGATESDVYYSYVLGEPDENGSSSRAVRLTGEVIKRSPTFVCRAWQGLLQIQPMTDLNLQFLFYDEATRKRLVEQVRNDAGSFQLSLKYRAYYRFLRPIMPIAVRQLLQRRRKLETADRWYQPAEFMRSLTDCLEASDQDLNTVHPWPAGAKFAFVLTHDVETAEGMRHIARVADAEESLGFRSSWNLVPYKYPIDMGLVNDLKARGFEIGIHGYNHDGRLFCSPQIFARRGVAINEAIKKYGAVGFRAPMVHRNLNWLQSLNIAYDSSCFDIDPFQAAPGGVGSIWPFIAGRFVELPYTLPQDHTLFVGLAEQDDRIWKDKLEFLIRYHGMALMLTHPDYLTGRRESNIYFGFLQHVKETGKFWQATPREVARWWRRREQFVELGLSDANPCQDAVEHQDFLLAGVRLKENGLQFVSH